MDIVVSQETGRVPVTVFHLQGQLNLGSAEQLEVSARQAYAVGARYVLVDLAGVTSLTSAGMRALLALTKLFSADPPKGQVSKNVKLLNPPPAILQVLKIAGFDAFLEILSDPANAVAAF